MRRRWPCVIRRFCAVGGGVAGGGGGADDAEAAPRSTPPAARTFVAAGLALSPGVSRRA